MVGIGSDDRVSGGGSPPWLDGLPPNSWSNLNGSRTTGREPGSDPFENDPDQIRSPGSSARSRPTATPDRTSARPAASSATHRPPTTDGRHAGRIWCRMNKLSCQNLNPGTAGSRPSSPNSPSTAAYSRRPLKRSHGRRPSPPHRRSSPRPLRRLAAARMPGVGPGAVQPPLYAGRQRRPGGFGTADRGPPGHPPAIRRPPDLGRARPRGLVDQQEEGASPLASARAEIGREAGRDQASPTSRPGRERLPSPPLAGPRTTSGPGTSSSTGPATARA